MTGVSAPRGTEGETLQITRNTLETSPGPGDWFTGAIDEVQTWSTVLTDADVAAVYARGAAAISPASP